MTAGPAGRVSALLGLLRPVAGEILVALDERAEPVVAAALSHVADRIVRYEYAPPVDAPLPWLQSQAKQPWVLHLDDDEIPSAALIEELPRLVGDDAVTHWWLPRRWLFPDATRYLDDAPWRPDYQLRLVRNDPRVVQFSSAFHRPIVAHGAGGFADGVLWHADPLLRSREARLAKAHAYERQRPGMRIAGRALNHAFYVPELRPLTPTTPLPDDDRALVESVVGARDPEGLEPAFAPERVTRAELERLWPPDPLPVEAYRARLELALRATTVTAGERRTVAVRVANEGTVDWGWGHDGEPAIRLAARWRDASGRALEREPPRTPLPRPIPAGATATVAVAILAPARPGRYRLELDLVHEHVRWFDAVAAYDVDVVPPRRVAFVGASLDQLLALLDEMPELEPVLVEPRGEVPAEPFGYRRIPGPGSYLLAGTERGSPAAVAATLSVRTSGLVAAAAARRLGRGGRGLDDATDAFLRGLAECRALVLVADDAPPASAPRRERWRLAATVAAARALGLRVVDARRSADLVSVVRAVA